MRNICMYSAQLHCQGGIESVVRDLHRIFETNGVRLWCAVEDGRPDWASEDECLILSRDIQERRVQWSRKISLEQPDLIVFNHVADTELVRNDVEHMHELGVKCAQMMHGSFPSAMLLKGCEMHNSAVFSMAKVCGYILTVSALDAIWWAALGLNAMSIQNPIKRMNRAAAKSLPEDDKVHLLWVGRMCDQKQPEIALEVFSKAYRCNSSLRMTMIGGGADKSLIQYVKNLGIDNVVQLLPSRSNIADLWDKADIHFLTSITESFCLVLAEAKSAGIPTVMFDIPFLDLCKDGRGLVALPQGDIQGMVDAIVKLSNDRTLREQLGHDAFESLSAFTDEKVFEDWFRAVEAIHNDVGFVAVDENMKMMAVQVFQAWNRYCDKNLWAVRMSEDFERILCCSMKPLGAFFSSLIKAFRNVRRWR